RRTAVRGPPRFQPASSLHPSIRTNHRDTDIQGRKRQSEPKRNSKSAPCPAAISRFPFATFDISVSLWLAFFLYALVAPPFFLFWRSKTFCFSIAFCGSGSVSSGGSCV